MTTISKNQMIEMLKNIKFATFIQVTYKGEQDMRKTGNPFDELGISKKTNMNVSFFGSYQNAVNNRLKKAGLVADFTAYPLPWGEWLTPNKIIAHKGEIYVRFYVHKNSNPKTEYFYCGEKMTNEQLTIAKTFFKERSESKRQSDAGLEADEQSKPFNVKVNNILQINVNGENYIVL